jgi:dihydroxy-acid dehydratase
MCATAGRRIVDMVWDDLTPQRILTPAAFDNAIRVHMAMGGSTNAIIHVVAMARRAGLSLDMQRFDQISREIPVLANVRPSGEFLMEDFSTPGAWRADARAQDKLDLSCVTVTEGRSPRTSPARRSICATSFIRSTIRSTPKARPPCSPEILHRAAA